MLKTKPLPGQKIRCVDAGGFSFYTEGKIYEVLDKEGDENTVWFIDDDGGENTTNVTSSWYDDEFELVPEENHMQTKDLSNTSNQVKPDEFRVGDVVWDLVFGKGKVTAQMDNLQDYTYPFEVTFDNGVEFWFTVDGKYNKAGNRTLFFSEPKFEASVTRPFVPTLVGKRVVVRYFDETWTRHPVVVTAETEEEIFTKNGSDYKCDIVEIYEVSSENLLTSKK